MGRKMDNNKEYGESLKFVEGLSLTLKKLEERVEDDDLKYVIEELNKLGKEQIRKTEELFTGSGDTTKIREEVTRILLQGDLTEIIAY
jgi:hypothetical protein